MATRFPVGMLPQQQQQPQQQQGRVPSQPTFYYASQQPVYGTYPPTTTFSPQQFLTMQQQQQLFAAAAQQQQQQQQQANQQLLLQQQLQYQQAAAHAQQQQQTALIQQTAALSAGGGGGAGGAMAHAMQQAATGGVVSPDPSHNVMTNGATLGCHPPGAVTGGAAGGASNVTKGKLEVEDEYGLMPLLRVLAQAPPMHPQPSLPQPGEEPDPLTGRTPSQRQQDMANFTYITRGFDLNSIGLPVSQQELLHPTVAMLALDVHTHYVLPEFRIPDCYKKPKPKPLSMKSFSYFKEETLFYIFYSMPRDVLHLAAARALYERNWRYHKETQQWFRPLARTSEGELLSLTAPEVAGRPLEEKLVDDPIEGKYFVGTYEIFDPHTWHTVKTGPDHKVMVTDVEEHRVLQAAMEEAARQQQQRQTSQRGAAAAEATAAATNVAS